MRRGPWHQFGDRSQRMVFEQLQQGVGVGVIISPRDLARHKAVEYAQLYHQEEAHVLIDQQFYFPNFSNPKLLSYSLSNYRNSVSQLHQITEPDLDKLSASIHSINKDIKADGLIAPAIVYEAGRPDIININSRLFSAAKKVGDNLGIPTYATIVIGRSATQATHTIDAILSHATSLDSDGWYYGFEFETERIPSARDSVLRCCSVGLTLACTGKPVLHAYAGPMGLLSFGFGATGAAIGHSQNLWKFAPERWRTTTAQGGAGNAPPRFFSSNLWGTIVYPDETVRITDPHLIKQILTVSPFSEQVLSKLPWSRWDANKHLVYTICSILKKISEATDPRANANSAINLLQESLSLHQIIRDYGIHLTDGTDIYQLNWMNAMIDLLKDKSDEFDYLDLIEN